MSGKGKEEGKKDGDPWVPFDSHAAFLGPTLWDKTLPCDTEFKLEYVDLDEFFADGEIPLDVDPSKGGPPHAHAHGPHGHATHGHLHIHPHPHSQHPPLPSQALPSAHTHGHGQHVLAHGSQSHPPPHLSSTGSTPPSPPQAQLPSTGKQSASSPVPSSTVVTSNSRGDHLHPNEGAHDFDPRSRPFSDDELKPQPMIKKSKKQFVPDEQKDDKYWARRRKNNMAAKRSRDARRMKENQISLRASFLEKENQTLKHELERVQKENQAMREKLAKYEKL